MKKNAVFILDSQFQNRIYQPDTIHRIAPLFQETPGVFSPNQLDSAEASSALENAEVIFSTWGAPKFDGVFLDRCPRLQAVFYGAGSVKGIVTPEFWQRDIVLCSAWRANAIPVAEFSLASIILSLKNVWAYHRLQKDKQWRLSLPMPGAFGSTVGLVSLGAIGRRVADMLRSYHISVLAYDPFCSAEVAGKLGVHLVPLEDVFERADVVSLHIPWLPETEKIINRSLLSRMKPSATLINTARGAVIDEDDLAAVLAERPDLTALLDVTHPEPPPRDSPLWTLPNCLMTPHVAGTMPEEWGRLGEFMAEEFERFCRGESLEHRVLPDMLDRMA